VSEATAATMLYECGECGEQGTERRCQDCNRFTSKLGPGGHCPACDEPILISDILDPNPRSTTETYTEDLTGSQTTQPER